MKSIGNKGKAAELDFIKIRDIWDFPCGPVVKTPGFQCRGMGSIPGQGTKIPHVEPHSQKTNKLTNKNLQLKTK